jgi:hypothetical protein
MQSVKPSAARDWKQPAPAYLFLSLGVLCSVAMTVLGLGIGAWTGIDAKTPSGFALFWILESLAFPAFLLRLFATKTPSWIFGLFFLADGVSLGLANLTNCTHSPCTTSNSLVMLLSGFRLPFIWGWVVLGLMSVLARLSLRGASPSSRVT